MQRATPGASLERAENQDYATSSTKIPASYTKAREPLNNWASDQGIDDEIEKRSELGKEFAEETNSNRKLVTQRLNGLAVQHINGTPASELELEKRKSPRLASCWILAYQKKRP